MEPFSYDLPESRIAQRPIHPPDAAKLLVYDRSLGKITDSTFKSIGEFLNSGDLLIFNDSKVIPSRLFGALSSGGEAEVLLLKRISPGVWNAMGRPLKKFRSGSRIIVTPEVSIEIIERVGTQEVIVKIITDAPNPDAAVLALGCMPIPPYIRSGRSDDQDVLDYQSIFAQIEGSIAAPTASLHFTDTLMRDLHSKGVRSMTVTLHVGAASFLALWEAGEDGPTKKPGREQFIYRSSVVEKILETRKRGGRVVAVGTTVVRALETMMSIESNISDGNVLETELFISPGYNFRAIDAMVTNFHQPRTTHLLLVEAFIGSVGLSKGYSHADASGYRFLSYGDGMLLL